MCLFRWNSQGFSDKNSYVMNSQACNSCNKQTKHPKNCEYAPWEKSVFFNVSFIQIQLYLKSALFKVSFDGNCEVWSKMWNLVKIVKFGQNYDVWSKLTNLFDIEKNGQHCEIWSKFLNMGQRKALLKQNLYQEKENQRTRFGQNSNIWSKSWNFV